jgi:hypothetical protein
MKNAQAFFILFLFNGHSARVLGWVAAPKPSRGVDIAKQSTLKSSLFAAHRFKTSEKRYFIQQKKEKRHTREG